MKFVRLLTYLLLFVFLLSFAENSFQSIFLENTTVLVNQPSLPYEASNQETGQTLTVGTTDSVQSSLDPANAYDYFGWEIIRSLGSGLVDYRPVTTGSPDIVPDLATNWSVSSDGLQYTFSLRQGVKYDDGTVFNATHVKYTFDRDIGMADPNGAFAAIGFGNIIQDITVVDTYTVRFDLTTPFAPFLSLIAGQECVMVDTKYAVMHGSSWNATTDVVLYTEGDARASNPMGLGPYTLVNWTRVGGKDTQMTLQANPNYWNASSGLPKTKNIIIQFYANSAELAWAITSGQVDIAFRQLSLTDINTLKTNSNLKVWQGTSAFIQYLCLQEKYAPFNETKIRQAVGAAINRTALVNAVFQGQAKNLYSLIPAGMFGHKDAFQSLGDPDYSRTQKLLAAFGYNATNKLTFNLWYETSGHYPQSARQAQALKSSIEASGVITVNLQSLDWPSYGNARNMETMQAFIMGWYPDYIDPDDNTYPFVDSTGGRWLHINYANPQMDLLIESARGNASLSVRKALYSQIQDLTVKDSPIIPLYQGLFYAVSKKGITGIYLDITQEFRYQFISSAGAQPTATMVFFNINPNPCAIGQTITVKGVLLDEYFRFLTNQAIKLYRRPLAGSWSFITSVATDDYGIFSLQVTVPSVPKGTYVFAARYLGSTTYNSSYNFAVLVIQ